MSAPPPAPLHPALPPYNTRPANNEAETKFRAEFVAFLKAMPHEKLVEHLFHAEFTRNAFHAEGSATVKKLSESEKKLQHEFAQYQSNIAQAEEQLMGSATQMSALQKQAEEAQREVVRYNPYRFTQTEKLYEAIYLQESNTAHGMDSKYKIANKISKTQSNLEAAHLAWEHACDMLHQAVIRQDVVRLLLQPKLEHMNKKKEVKEQIAAKKQQMIKQQEEYRMSKMQAALQLAANSAPLALTAGGQQQLALPAGGQQQQFGLPAGGQQQQGQPQGLPQGQQPILLGYDA